MMTTTVIKVKPISIPMPPRLKRTSAAEADCNAMARPRRGIPMQTVACAGARGLESDSCGRAAGDGNRFDLKQEAVDAAHDYGLANGYFGGGDGIPKFAVDKDLAPRRQEGLRDAGLSHHAIFSGYNLVAACLEG